VEFRRSALNCESCGFIAALLDEEGTTPMDEDQTATIRVDNGGRRFTGQWHGALVTELYEPGKRSCAYWLKNVHLHLQPNFE
jgi:hypothetical protein